MSMMFRLNKYGTRITVDGNFLIEHRCDKCGLGFLEETKEETSTVLRDPWQGWGWKVVDRKQMYLCPVCLKQAEAVESDKERKALHNKLASVLDLFYAPQPEEYEDEFGSEYRVPDTKEKMFDIRRKIIAILLDKEKK